ncbi:Aspartate aminotransferase family protein OS=Lysinibacillus sphaericus OX=1421 GN=LS41612_16240 PE=3 SV=1 [Lysinibacillus sphaericus]
MKLASFSNTAISPIFVQETMKLGLILRTVTYEQDTVVFAPPLILSKAELNEMLRILHESFELVWKTIIAKD